MASLRVVLIVTSVNKVDEKGAKGIKIYLTLNVSAEVDVFLLLFISLVLALAFLVAFSSYFLFQKADLAYNKLQQRLGISRFYEQMK